MRRHLITIPILLLAGAVVNVAVAWGCVICVDPLDPWGMFPLRGEIIMPGRVSSVVIYEQAGVVAIKARATRDPKIGTTISGEGVHSGGAIRGRGTLVQLTPSWSNIDPRMREIETFDLGKTERLSMERRVVGSGWPLRSLRAELSGVIWNDRILHRFDSEGGYIETSLAPWPENFPRVLPLHPIWPGLFVNTLFYAAILWSLIPGSFALRRLIRRRRGLCPACAYPMGGSATCTECGKELPKRAVA